VATLIPILSVTVYTNSGNVGNVATLLVVMSVRSFTNTDIVLNSYSNSGNVGKSLH